MDASPLAGPVTITITAAAASPGWKFTDVDRLPARAGPELHDHAAQRHVSYVSVRRASRTPMPARKFRTSRSCRRGLDVPSHRRHAGARASPACASSARSTAARWRIAAPGMGLGLPEGEHRVAVGAIDPSGNPGPVLSTRFTVIDTQLLSAPVEGCDGLGRGGSWPTSRSRARLRVLVDRGAFSACGRGINPER